MCLSCWEVEEGKRDDNMPPAAVETCLDCKAGLALANASVLKGFCQSCFDKHMEERQKLAEEAQNLRALAQQAEEFVVDRCCSSHR